VLEEAAWRNIYPDVDIGNGEYLAIGNDGGNIWLNQPFSTLVENAKALPI
jgi:hypothetical protein